MFAEVLNYFITFFTRNRLEKLLLVILVFVVGIIVTRVVSALIGRISKKYLTRQYSMLIRKAVYYSCAVIVLIIILQLLGVKVGALLGAAGIAGIAIGFASQTSMSNLISGLFLISEKPFEVGDVIRVDKTFGVVQSIDLLSVKINTFDNLFIRIPNEKLINTEITNITRYPIRRMDIKLKVAYKSSISKVKDALQNVAANNPLCLDEPQPLILFTDFGEFGMEFLFGLWFYKTDYLALKNSVMQDIKEKFDGEGIEIPFPHLSLYAGSATEPLPVSISNSDNSD